MSNETTTHLDLFVEEAEALEAPFDWGAFAAGVGAGLLVGAVIAT
jgi:hypothetical protein